mgnify:CR=1 FL=1
MLFILLSIFILVATSTSHSKDDVFAKADQFLRKHSQQLHVRTSINATQKVISMVAHAMNSENHQTQLYQRLEAAFSNIQNYAIEHPEEFEQASQQFLNDTPADALEQLGTFGMGGGSDIKQQLVSDEGRAKILQYLIEKFRIPTSP